MDLFIKSFGSEFEPHLDNDASIKFILNTLMMDKGMDRLAELLDVSQDVGCIEGEPGWELERIEDENRGLVGYAEWPAWAYFRAYVDPDFYELTVPEAYYTVEDFQSFASKAVNTYLHEYSEQKGSLEELVKLVNNL